MNKRKSEEGYIGHIDEKRFENTYVAIQTPTDNRVISSNEVLSVAIEKAREKGFTDITAEFRRNIDAQEPL